MDFGSLIQGLVGGLDEGPQKAPKWLVGKRVCPLLIGDELFWRLDQMIVRGVPPIGMQYKHSDPHKLPAGFGPVGEAKQVVPGSPTLSGIVPLQNELGETMTYVIGKLISYLLREITPFIFAYPHVDDKPQLIAVMQSGFEPDDEGNRRRIFRTYAFITPAMHNIHHFLLPEEREQLPRYTGITNADDEPGMDLRMVPYNDL